MTLIPNLPQAGPKPLHLCAFFQKMLWLPEECVSGRPSLTAPAVLMCTRCRELPFPPLCPALLPHSCSGLGCDRPSQLPVSMFCVTAQGSCDSRSSAGLGARTGALAAGENAPRLPRGVDARRSPQHVKAYRTLLSLPLGPPCFSQHKTLQKQKGGLCSRQDNWLCLESWPWAWVLCAQAA